MKKVRNEKIMIPGAFCKGKRQNTFYIPPTRFLFGADSVQGDQQFLFRVNMIQKNIHGYYSEPIPYKAMERVEYAEGSSAKNTLKIVTREINGTFYLCLSELCAAQIAQVKALLEACIEEGCFGEKAAALAKELENPLEKTYANHLKLAGISLALMLFIGYYCSVTIASIPCMIAAVNARVTRYPVLSYIPWLIEFLLIVVVSGL